MSKSVSRRDFLRVASIGATGVLLAACQPKVVEVTKLVEKVVKETVIVEGEVKTVEKIVKETVVVEKVVEKEAAAPTDKIVRVIIDSWLWARSPSMRLPVSTALLTTASQWRSRPGPRAGIQRSWLGSRPAVCSGVGLASAAPTTIPPSGWRAV